jgi:hypothetical protein
MPMPKDSGTASREGTRFRKDRAIVPLIQPWQPSQLKTGLGNRRIGKRVSLFVWKST